MHLMAKCTTGNDSIRQGYLDSARAWSCSNYYNHQSHGQSEIFQSETFKKRKRAEYRNIYSKNISTLEQNIIRVFEESLHSDLYIINGDNVLQTNCCILKTRSPHLYNVLEKYFRYNKNLIKCYLNTPTIFHQLRGFLRLLYCNSDVTTQEQHLIELLIANSEEKKLINGFIKNKKSCSIDDDDDDDNVDVSPNTSEMADSGLETGSGSTHENTESENSATDVEESHVTDYVSTDDDFIRVSLSGDVEKTCNKNAMTTHRHNECSTKHIPINNQEEGTETISSDVCACGASESKQPNQKHCIISNINDKTKTCEIADDDVDDDDVIRYENEVLNDPFYESDSNGNEQSGSFVPTGSFEFIEPGNLSPSNSTRQEFTNQSVDKNACTNLETRSMIVENLRYGLSQSNDLSLKKSSSSINNYYFIDASSLNDETEIAAMNATTDESMSGVSLPTYLENVSYIPTNSIIDSNEQNNSFINRKSSLQSGHEKIAEFERELKLTEYLKPIVEPRKIKRADSMTDEKIIEEKPSFEKESLVVEIKEADSGESNHPSPCIDNNKRVQRENNVECCLDDENSTDNLSNSRRSSLVRQNTFELESGGERLSYLQQEYERRQGNLVFKNSIPQYSGHRVDGDLTYDGTNYSSMPYFPTESRTRSRRDVNSSRYIFTDAIADCSKSLNQNYGNVDDDSNGIYPISKSASDKLLATGSETDDSSITDCNSLPATFDFPCDTGRKSTVKRSKRDELTPIISGGVSTNDYLKSVDSPAVRRKSELTPIVSGDSVSTNTTTVKTRSTRMSSSMNNAWVVDMSDCGRGNSRSNNDSSSSSMSQSYSFSESANKSVNKIKSTDKPSSLGFFVNLNDIHCPKQQTSLHNSNTKNNKSNNNLDKEKNDQDMKQQSCEFFVDISKESMKMKKIPKKTENHNSKSCASGGSADKKNIFSIFIDLNEQDNEKKSVDGEKSDRLSTHNPDEASRECDSKSSPQESRSIEKKPSVFMFIDSDSPVVRRRTLSASKPIFQRHSWNMDKFPVQNNGHVKETTFRREHKRAHSVSIDPGLQKILQVKTDGSRCSLSQIGRATSLQTSVTTREKEMTSSACTESFDYGIRDTPPNSHVELINDNLRSCVKRHEYNELIHNDNMCSSTEASGDLKVSEDDRSDVWDKTATESTEGHTRKSETFDISSGSASGPSPGSDNQVFELGDYTNEPSTFTDRRQIEHPIPSKIAETHKSLTETIKKIECEFNKQEYNTDENYVDIPSDIPMTQNKSEIKDSKEMASCSGFVRLSDLDKTPAKNETNESEDSGRPRSLSYRMSTSIPEMSWVESKLAVNRTHGPCQVRTLASRKFTSIMSTSLPAKHKSPIEEFANECEGEGIISESDLSSMQSSMGRSGADVSTEETETSSFANGKPYNRLGEDLLRMFLEEINPDVTIEINGRRIRAHKCILSSRCQYFAAILSGGWIESAGNVISLQGYSYSAVHFALCHIYSGENNIPESISIVELATLADMLCLEGLKEVIGYTIKVKYCHLFHKPCQICAVGVLECMPLAAAYGLDEVYRKSLRWITRHFVRIWPCKAFATLPRELMDKCYHQHIVHMSADNVLQTIMDCDKLLATLPNARWAEPVFKLVSNLLETALKFLSDNFSNVLSNDSFQALGGDLTWNISRLEDNVLASADRLPPDQACKSYSKLYKMLASIQVDNPQLRPSWGPLFIDFLEKIQAHVEKCLVKEASRAARTTTWLKMDLELRRRIQELACLVILPHEIIKRPSRHSNFMKESKTPPSRSSASRSLDLKRVKMTITTQNDKASKQITVQPPKKFIPKPKSDPLERKMPEVKQLVTESIRPKSWPNKLEVKSRYLEPRTKSVPKETVHQTLPERMMAQQRRKIMISSSDSSRTSSPAMKRANDKKPMVKMKLTVKKDVKAFSSDSLTDTASVKPTIKRDVASKSCGITRPESPLLKPKDTEIGLSADSLVDTKKKPITVKKTGKMDTSMSTDSLMNEVTTVAPKSSASNKISPTLGRPTAKSLALERSKKSSPPVNQKSPLTIARRPIRSVESSTAASRNRAAAINTYHGSPNLRRNLLEAAKTPDIPPNKIANGVVPRVNARQTSSGPSTSTSPAMKRDKKESTPLSSESPSKRSPKSNGVNRPNRAAQIVKKNISKGTEEKGKTKCHNNGDAVKQFTVGSRSGTFLKDEPTILKKSDMKTMQVMS